MRPIDADALIEKYGDWYVEEGTESGFIGTLKGLFATVPTIHPVATDINDGDLISRKMVLALRRNKIRSLHTYEVIEETINVTDIENLPSAQPDNQTNLCDSCDYSYPDCPSKNDDVIFGNGIGNDNICACNKYKPSTQPEITDGQAIEHLQESGWMQNHDKQMYEMGLREQLADDSDSYDALLPSAQPELAQDLRNACTDAISRQAAIDAMANTLWHYPNECYRNLSKYEFAKGLAELGLKSVPSAQPEQFVKGCRNCKYGKYNDHWKTHFCYNPNNCTEWNLWEPSAQPERKTGHWIEIALSNHSYKCSVCGRLLVNITDGKDNVTKNYPYCHCGADMRGEKDDEQASTNND